MGFSKKRKILVLFFFKKRTKTFAHAQYIVTVGLGTRLLDFFSSCRCIFLDENCPNWSFLLIVFLILNISVNLIKPIELNKRWCSMWWATVQRDSPMQNGRTSYSGAVAGGQRLCRRAPDVSETKVELRDQVVMRLENRVFLAHCCLAAAGSTSLASILWQENCNCLCQVSLAGEKKWKNIFLFVHSSVSYKLVSFLNAKMCT